MKNKETKGNKSVISKKTQSSHKEKGGNKANKYYEDFEVSEDKKNTTGDNLIEYYSKKKGLQNLKLTGLKYKLNN